MQSTQAMIPYRFLLLSPAAMATAFAVLAFLRGLFAWPLLALLHAGMGGMWLGRKPGGPGGLNPPGPLPGGPSSVPMPGGPGPWQMPDGPHGYGPEMHHFGFMLSPFTYVLIWLATIVVAAVAGALLALIYNWVAARTGRVTQEAAPAA